jgi:hypothetical protein
VSLTVAGQRWNYTTFSFIPRPRVILVKEQCRPPRCDTPAQGGNFAEYNRFNRLLDVLATVFLIQGEIADGRTVGN